MTYASNYEGMYAALAKQQELFGELQYLDRDAAISFCLPMHPLAIRPDYSPIKTVGVGSLACITIDLEVYQRLCEDFAERELTGMPKHKANHVVLYLEVENVARNNFPSVMSIDQYTQLKSRNLLSTLPQAKTVGAPLSLAVGKRGGRSFTATFTYEADGNRQADTVKAMLVSTLVGNNGVTAMYFTRMAQGLFDAHLYLYQQLLRNIRFFDERELTPPFSRFKSVTVRLTDQDIPKTYASASARDKTAMERHINSLLRSTDGKVEGADIIDLKSLSLAALPPKTLLAESVNSEGPPSRSQDFMVESTSPIPVDGIERFTDTADYESLPSPVHVTSSTGDEQQCVPTGQTQGPTPPTDVAEGPSASTRKPSDESPSPTAEAQPQAATAPPDHEETAVGAPKQASSPSPDNDIGDGASTKQDRDPVSESPAQPPAPHPTITQEEFEAALAKDAEAHGPSLRELYAHCCEQQHCKPNSYLLTKLPDNPKFTSSIEEFDMSRNYVGHAGFVALLNFLEYLPNVKHVFFNGMQLDNEDVLNLSQILAKNESITSIEIRSNQRITLPSVQYFSRLLRANPRITSLNVEESHLGPTLVQKLREDAERNALRATVPSTKPTSGKPAPLSEEHLESPAAATPL